jgi:leucyl aminopeptidase (aminopeptidase T)
MPTILDLELASAAYKVVRDLVNVKPGESLLITIDSAGVWRVAEETAKAAEALGAKVMVAWHSTPPGYGKVGDPFLPDSLKAAIPNTDIWIEYNYQWLLYGQPWEDALKETKRVRYLFLGGLNEEQIIRTIGKVDLKLQEELQNLIVEKTAKSSQMKITTPAGTDISFMNSPDRPIGSEGWARTPGAHFLIGQIGWAPIEESINGTVVFDGSFSGGGKADLGVLKHPITFRIQNGKWMTIEGHEEADFLRGWFSSLNDLNMHNVAHVCYGFNPGAHLSGLCTEDERVWGSTEWGFGYQGPFFKGNAGPAITHVDGICLNSSVWLDGEQILDKGIFVNPELAAIARQIGKQ